MKLFSIHSVSAPLQLNLVESFREPSEPEDDTGFSH